MRRTDRPAEGYHAAATTEVQSSGERIQLRWWWASAANPRRYAAELASRAAQPSITKHVLVAVQTQQETPEGIDGVVAVGNPVEGDLLPVPALAVARPFVPDFPHHHRTRDHRRELLAPGIGVVRGDVLRRRHDKGWWRSGYCHSHRDSARVRFGRRVQDLTIDEKVTRKKQLNAVPSGPLP